MKRERRETIVGCGSISRIKPKTNRLTGAILLGSTVFLCAGEGDFWVVGGQLEAVARYQYQGSDESEGIRLNSRYARRADDTDNGTDLLAGPPSLDSAPTSRSFQFLF